MLVAGSGLAPWIMVLEVHSVGGAVPPLWHTHSNTLLGLLKNRCNIWKNHKTGIRRVVRKQKKDWLLYCDEEAATGMATGAT